MSAIIPAILALLQTIIPALNSATAIGSVIATLIQIVPVLIKEFKDLVPMVQNIITVLKGNDNITPDQIVQLQALDAQCDTAFEAAATDAEAEDTKD